MTRLGLSVHAVGIQMNWIMKCALLITCLSLLPMATAQELAPEDAAEVKRLVGQMGHEEFEVREKASNQLMRRVEREPEFAKYLEHFAKHEDPEIRARINELIKDLPVTLEWMDPAREKEVKSLRLSPDRVELTIKNRSKITIKTYWIDWDGKRVARRTLKPGEQGTIKVTYREHYWLVTDENETGLGLYCPGKKDAQIVYTGEERKKG